MPHLIDKNRRPSVPLGYGVNVSSGTSIFIQLTPSDPFDAWCDRVRAVCRDNGVAQPDNATLEATICGQMPGGWCTDDNLGYVSPPPPQPPPCGSCGGFR